MNFHPDALSHQQQEILKIFGTIASRLGFYLGGGTALAIYYAHRRSLDLDWFTDQPIQDPLQLAQMIRDQGLDFVAAQTAPGTLHGSVSSVRMSFFEFRYPLLQPLVHWNAIGCNLASLDDLACMKLAAIAQRGSRKDFIDIHTLLSKHRPLEELLPLYQKKFVVQDISSVLYGLAYFEDAQNEPSPQMLWKISWSQIKKDISRWVKEYSSTQ